MAIYKKKVIIIRGKEHMADLNKGINISHLKNIITKTFKMKEDEVKLVIRDVVYPKYFNAKAKSITVMHLVKTYHN